MIKKQENGFVLVSGLIILLIMTLIVLYGTSNSLIQEKNSGNLQDQNLAFQTAEQALRKAEDYVFSNLTVSSSFNTTCTGGLCLPNLTTPVWESINWDSNTANTLALSTTITGVYKQPRFMVELLDTAPLTPGETIKSLGGPTTGLTFRITVVAWGSRSGSKAMVQSIYVKR